MTSTLRRGSTLALTVGAMLSFSLVSFADVSPASYSNNLDPGAEITITKTVTTPEIPPKPDIVLLVDNTGSMGGIIDTVKTNMASIVTTVKGTQPGAQFAVASYRDVDEAGTFVLQHDLTASESDTTDAVNAISAGGGGDTPEAQLNALNEVATGAVTWRADSSRIVVWFGDAPGHDPSNGVTEAMATTALGAAHAKVIAINVGNLDGSGQATRIAAATGGVYDPSGAGDIVGAILAGLSNLPVEVTPMATCDAGLSVTFDNASSTVTSGKDAIFEETIKVASDATQGATLTCTTDFYLNGEPGGDGFVQTVSITVNDVTPPTVACSPGPNPAGKITSQALKNGFYTMTAGDNLPGVTVMVTDLGTGTEYGAYDPGTTMKLTKASGSTSSAVPGTGAVNWQFNFKGNAQLTATDAAGNSTSVVCTVPSANK